MKRLLALVVLAAGAIEASESVTRTAGVATGSRLATQAAVSVLRDGGTAMDAATAAAFVLAVARPDAAGLGGGGMLVYHDATENATWSLDFRETGPFAEVEEDAQELSGAAAAGTPGFVAGLADAHRRFGSAPWRDLLSPAIHVAEEGFDVDLALMAALSAAVESESLDATARAALLAGGGTGALPRRIVQPDLAATLNRIARTPADFYKGTIASKLVASKGGAGGNLSIRDMREYRPVWRAPLRIDLGAYSIVTAPPPARGGVAIASTLAILGAFDLGAEDLTEPGPSHIFAEADRRATFDSKRVVADPAFARLAIGSILSADRAAFWRSTILPDKATPTPRLAVTTSTPSDHTTHISVIDAKGNVASLTVSLGAPFGSGVMVPGTGILLNAALRDFSTPSTHANARAPRKRPATPVAPLILFREGQPILAAGASGGDAISSCLAALIIRLTSHDFSLRETIDAPRLHQPDYPDRVVYEAELQSTAETLEAMGHGILRVNSIGEINAVMIGEDGIISVADPRGKGASGGY